MREGPLIFSHKSVLLKEALEWLAPKEGSVIVDGTLGAGGHAEAILEKLGTRGRLVGFDKDPAALDAVAARLKKFGEQALMIQDDFKNIQNRLQEAGIASVDGILLDLGISSVQLDDESRGFSFSKKGPLDMRMNPKNPLSAKEVVNRTGERELADLLWQYGEERFARRIADRIVRERSKKTIETTEALEDIIFRAVPASHRHGRIHPATRSFQALRIVVNDELGSLKAFLSVVISTLASGGRVVIISFHSLEDRAVKLAFRDFEKKLWGRVLTKKPVTPGESEEAENPRSRSAKLRAFEKKPAGDLLT